MIITMKETGSDLKKYDSSIEGKKRFVNDLLQPLFLNIDSWEKISYELGPRGQEHVVMTHKNPDKSLVVNVTADSLLSLTKDVMDAVFHKDEAVGLKGVLKALTDAPVFAKYECEPSTDLASTSVLSKYEYRPIDLDFTGEYRYSDSDKEWVIESCKKDGTSDDTLDDISDEDDAEDDDVMKWFGPLP